MTSCLKETSNLLHLTRQLNILESKNNVAKTKDAILSHSLSPFDDDIDNEKMFYLVVLYMIILSIASNHWWKMVIAYKWNLRKDYLETQNWNPFLKTNILKFNNSVTECNCHSQSEEISKINCMLKGEKLNSSERDYKCLFIRSYIKVYNCNTYIFTCSLLHSI